MWRAAGNLFWNYAKDKAGSSVSVGLVGGGLNVAGALFDAYQYKKSRPKADWTEMALYTGINYVLWSSFAPVMLAWALKDVAGALGSAAMQAYLRTPRIPGSRPGGVIGRGFFDNAAKATMRQRAVEAIQESRIRANYALGSEARRISRGYFDAF